jgi:hypothetical protein
LTRHASGELCVPCFGDERKPARCTPIDRPIAAAWSDRRLAVAERDDRQRELVAVGSDEPGHGVVREDRAESLRPACDERFLTAGLWVASASGR